MDLGKRKQLLCQQIVDALTAALDKDEISSDDLPVISSSVLDEVNSATDENQLQAVLKGLADEWPVLANLVVLEQGQAKEKVEDEVAKGVSTLAQSGKIDDAISLAKTATENKATT